MIKKPKTQKIKRGASLRLFAASARTVSPALRAAWTRPWPRPRPQKGFPPKSEKPPKFRQGTKPTISKEEIHTRKKREEQPGKIKAKLIKKSQSPEPTKSEPKLPKGKAKLPKPEPKLPKGKVKARQPTQLSNPYLLSKGMVPEIRTIRYRGSRGPRQGPKYPKGSRQTPRNQAKIKTILRRKIKQSLIEHFKDEIGPPPDYTDFIMNKIINWFQKYILS